MDATKPAWRFDDNDEAEIRSLDSEAWIPWTTLDVDATKPAGRFDAAEIRSLDSDAWIPWNGCYEGGVEVLIWHAHLRRKNA